MIELYELQLFLSGDVGELVGKMLLIGFYYFLFNF